MELTMERQTYHALRQIISCTGKQTIDTDFTLPDYCGDIKRILHCEVLPQLRSVSAKGDRPSAEGEVLVRLLYVNEQNEADCFEHSMPLSVHCRNKELDGDTILTASPATEYVNCRAVSPRKFQIDGTVTVRFDAQAKRETGFVQSIESCEVKQKEITFSALSAAAQKTVDLSETVALSEQEPAIGSILRVIGTPIVQSTEAVDDKLLIKGELRLKIVCLSVDHKIRSISHVLPISQVIEAPGLQPEDQTDLSIKIYALYVQPKRDAADEARLLDIAAKLSIVVQAYQDQTACVITDCYAIGGSLTPVFREQRFLRLIAMDPLQMNTRQVFETGVKNGHLLEASVVGTTTETVFSEEQIKLTHHVTIAALIEDNDKAIDYSEHTVDIEQTVPQSMEYQNYFFSPHTIVSPESAHLNRDGVLQVDLSSTVCGSCFGCMDERILVDASKEETTETGSAQIILSFCKKEDSLWDIGKRYHVPVRQIKEENGLTEEDLPEDCMLLISAIK